MIITSVSHRDEMLHKVITLGDKNKQTLGMLPEGAFHQHARRKTILAAIDDGKLAGYLLYRISQKKRFVSITHLCVSPEYQGRGISTSLLMELKGKYKDVFSGMMLSCRADYSHASRLWEKFGFKARTKKRSRAKKEFYLVKWIYDFGNPNLFSDLPSEGQKIRAVLDSSVLIKLSESSTRESAEVHSLEADWLEDEVEFVCTQEVFNEINRDENLLRAQKTRDFLRKFEVINFRPDLRDRLAEELKLLIKGKTDNAESDRKQIAEAMAAGVMYFVTLDQELLDLNESLYQKYSIEILRPVEFVLLVDEVSNSLDYRSFRLAGADYDTSRIRGEDIEPLVRSFSGCVPNETRQELRTMISECANDVTKGLVRVVRDKTAEAIASYGIVLHESNLIVRFIRIKRTNISSVLFQQLIRDIILLGIRKACNTIVVKEIQLLDDEKLMLQALGFDLCAAAWRKICLTGFMPLSDVLSHIVVKNGLNIPASLFVLSDGTVKTNLVADLERKLWPLKIEDLDLPVYIIPIRPLWAAQLFDFYIANVSLFGATPSLAWSRENIYYRSVNPVSEKAPARILWYVSSEEKVIGRSRGIVATSYLDEVYVDRAKDIFRKYKRFGVYEWKDIYQLADGAVLSEIKALKFSDTEVFRNVVTLDKINEIMIKNNRRTNTFASPVEVSIAIFKEIYVTGKNE
ncbi:GNAT family N-acetyltransferase [Pseudochryseolinea flava]|uniref:N-acetyltransferase domain-containing protein n=1 Tax=Pseudochryseolinea flava TaxID=2059302 RepID=A0A364Y430_9BACT|nr:GNAT family N-acetyltransferase [Pseudochryseolinea flava]RAW01084.1 hypothetical protein DQQ10_12715 [Pseudochryseolinea flava]